MIIKTLIPFKHFCQKMFFKNFSVASFVAQYYMFVKLAIGRELHFLWEKNYISLVLYCTDCKTIVVIQIANVSILQGVQRVF